MSDEWEMENVRNWSFSCLFLQIWWLRCTSVAFFPRIASWSGLKSGTFLRISSVLTKVSFDIWSNCSGVQWLLSSSSSSISWVVGTGRWPVLPSLSAERHRRRQRHSRVVATVFTATCHKCLFLTWPHLTPSICCHIGNDEKDFLCQSFRFLGTYRLQEVEKIFHPRLKETEGGKTCF